MRRSTGVALSVGFIVFMFLPFSMSAETMPSGSNNAKHPLAQEHPITIDATAITPPKVWSVPGATEPLQSLTGNLTNEVKTLNLRPGRHMFTTTSFSFEFTVDLEGKLNYSKTHEHCLQGRGTTKLTVNCRFTMPQ